jgi:hypothetical protein
MWNASRIDQNEIGLLCGQTLDSAAHGQQSCVINIYGVDFLDFRTAHRPD